MYPRFSIPLILVLLFCCAPAYAAKVTLSPDNWGHESGEECVSCHSKASSGLTQQWKDSAHSEAGVNCMDCHQADADDADAITHEGFTIATIVSPKDCGRCHTTEVEQHTGSVHSEAVALIADRMPAMTEHVSGAAMNAGGCTQCHGSVVKVKADGSLDPATWPNSGIGRVNPDGSKGSCSSCHGRHRFSKAQAREPEACVRCHSGPDSPDKEVFEASKHGMIYSAYKSEMNLNADTWVAGKDYTAAPTCTTCHMGAAGKIPSTHDVGMRNMWSLNSPVSEKQSLVMFQDGSKIELPDTQKPPRRGKEFAKMDGSMGKVKGVAGPKRRRQVMSAVCLECHSKEFTKSFMRQFDDVVELYNDKFGKPAQAIMQALYAEGKLTPAPFDEPIEFIYWELWHDEGARARHGASMGSPNHAWWEGMYIVGRNFYSRFLPEVRALGAEALIEQHVKANPNHAWLNDTSKPNPILGYPMPAEEPEQSPEASQAEANSDD